MSVHNPIDHRENAQRESDALRLTARLMMLMVDSDKSWGEPGHEGVDGDKQVIGVMDAAAIAAHSALPALLADNERLTAENKRLRAVLGEDDIDTFLADELTDPAFAGAYLAARENSTAKARADAAEARLTQLRGHCARVADALDGIAETDYEDHAGITWDENALLDTLSDDLHALAASVVSETGEKP